MLSSQATPITLFSRLQKKYGYEHWRFDPCIRTTEQLQKVVASNSLLRKKIHGGSIAKYLMR